MTKYTGIVNNITSTAIKSGFTRIIHSTNVYLVTVLLIDVSDKTNERRSKES